MYAGLLHKLKSYGISNRIFGLILSFFSNRWLRVCPNVNSPLEYPVNACVPQGSILHSKLVLLYIGDLSNDGICNIAIFADTTYHSKHERLAFEFASDLQDSLWTWTESDLLI